MSDESSSPPWWATARVPLTTLRIVDLPHQTACFLKSAPGTVAYFLAVVVTTLSVRDTGDRLLEVLIRTQESTNIHNLLRDPVRVLFVSAFWLDAHHVPVSLILLFLIVVAPVERKVGTWRWLVVGAASHVISTIITQSAVGWGIRHGLVKHRESLVSDVGFSYFTFALVAVFIWLLPGKLRLVLAAGFAAFIVWPLVANHTFTDWGHFFAMLIGFTLAPWATKRSEPFRFDFLRLPWVDRPQAVVAMPPSTGSTAPVTYDEARDAR